MYVEYCNYNRNIEDYNEESNIILNNVLNINGIAVPISLLNKIKTYLPKEIKTATSIDYPLSQSTTKTRLHACSEALKAGVNYIDYIPQHYHKALKYEDHCAEVNTFVTMCNEYNASLRIFLTDRYLYNNIAMARIYSTMGIDICMSSIGYHSEDFYDNLLICKEISSKTDMSMMFSSTIWQKKQIEMIKKAKIFGIRLYNLKLWCT